MQPTTLLTLAALALGVVALPSPFVRPVDSDFTGGGITTQGCHAFGKPGEGAVSRRCNEMPM